MAGNNMDILLNQLPVTDRYTYNYIGNFQALDGVLATRGLQGSGGSVIDVVHSNAGEYYKDQSSDHDALVTLHEVVAPQGNTQKGTRRRAVRARVRPDCRLGYPRLTARTPWRRWCIDPRAASTATTRRLHDPIANEAGRPTSVMRFRMLHAIAASVSWAMGCRARSRPPMIDLYLKKAFSTRAVRVPVADYPTEDLLHRFTNATPVYCAS